MAFPTSPNNGTTHSEEAKNWFYDNGIWKRNKRRIYGVGERVSVSGNTGSVEQMIQLPHVINIRQDFLVTLNIEWYSDYTNGIDLNGRFNYWTVRTQQGGTVRTGTDMTFMIGDTGQLYGADVAYSNYMIVDGSSNNRNNPVDRIKSTLIFQHNQVQRGGYIDFLCRVTVHLPII